MNIEKPVETEKVKTYLKLVARVLRIDKKAAEYLLKKAPNLECFDYSDIVLGCFVWTASPQGYEYWRDIHNRLCQDQ